MGVLEPRDEIDRTAERVLGEEVVQTPPCLRQANISAESAQRSQRQSRLFRIKFPRVEVDHRHPGPAIAERLAQAMPHDPQRQQPEITAPSYFYCIRIRERLWILPAKPLRLTSISPRLGPR